MNAAPILFNQVNPTFVFAVRALASLDSTDPRKLRSAFRVTLEAAGVDLSALSRKARVTPPHALVCWYDMTSAALRLFVVAEDNLDDTTIRALELLDGSIIGDWENHAIEDADAAIRLMALMGTGGETAAELFTNHVAPNRARYDEDFTAPTEEDLAELWCSWRDFYIGGTTTPPRNIEASISRAFAFGI